MHILSSFFTVTRVLLLSAFLGWTFLTSFVFAEEACLEWYDKMQKEFFGTISNKENTLIDVLAWFQDTWSTKWGLIEYFCDTRFLEHDTDKTDVKNMQHQCVDLEEWMRIDPRQSFFMYWLCVGYDESMRKKEWSDYTPRDWKKKITDLTYPHPDGKDDIATNIENFIPKDIQDNLLETWWGLESSWDACHPHTWMNNCLMWYPSTRIVYNVFSWLFDIKKAAIDGYDHGKKKKDVDEALRDISRSLFNVFEDWKGKSSSGVCLDTNKTFISDNDSPADEATSHCRHPQTWGFVKWMIQGAINNVDQVTMIDGHAIMEAPCLDLAWTMASCAMSNVVTLPEPEWPYGAADNDLWSEEVSWRNMLENELFFLQLWKDYYETVLLNNTRYQWWWESADLSDKVKRSEYEVDSFNTEIKLIENAVDTMTNLLSQYRMMYHQCIALNAYQEDLHYFWQRVNKKYTPLHQILYITQDAQEKNEDRKYSTE